MRFRCCAISSYREFSSISFPSPRVGFIGLGNMGSGMAINLHKKGAYVVAHDVTTDSLGVKTVRENDISFAKTLDELLAKHVEDAPLDYIVSMLPASQHVSDLYRKGIFPALSKSSVSRSPLLIDCSSIDMVTAKEVAEEAKKQGLRMVDAPVSGGAPAASAGTLTFMVGGEKADFENARVALKMMGPNAFHCGKNSLGQAMKACNNLILAASMLGTAEGFRLGVTKFGIDAKTFYEVVNTSSGRCWSSETYCPCPDAKEGTPATRDYQPPSFMVDLMAKDLGLALSAVEAVGGKAPMTEHSLKVYKEVQAAGHGKLDFGCVYKHMPGAK